ncbi:MAG: CHASE2 domain-containing protein [Fibrobacter sp.]|nr:CHASE2 domain-containing protein [Fibrobacter sp.]
MELLKKFLKSLLIGSLVGLGIALLTRFFLQDLIDKLEYVTYYMRSKWEYSEMSSEDLNELREREYGINIIDIDDRSMQKMGTYQNWNRRIHADLTNTLSRHFPAAIIFDIFFSTREDKILQSRFNSMLEESKKIDTSIILSDQMRNAIVSTIDYDNKFVNATKTAGIVFHGMCLTDESDYHNLVSPVKHLGLMSYHDSLNPASTLLFTPEIRKKIALNKTFLDGIFPELARASKAIGHINISPSEDGVIRDTPLLYGFGNNPPVYLPISVRAVLTLIGTPNDEVIFEPGRYIEIGKPFKAFKDLNGQISFSYPNVSGSQIKLILMHKDEILALQPGKKAEISSFLAASRSDNGCISLEMNLPGTIPCELTELLFKADFSSILNLTEQQTLELAPDVQIRKDSETDWVISAPFDAGEWWFSKTDLQTLAMCDQTEFTSIASGSQKLIFNNFSIKNLRGSLVSSLPCLRDQAIRELLSAGWESIESITPGSRMDFGPTIRIPLGPDNRHTITFFGPKGQPFKPYSYYDILNDRIQGNLDGKIFIVGSTAAGLFDIKAVPHDRSFPAVEIHASLINSFLTNTFVKRLDSWADFLILLLIGVVIGVISFMLKPLPGAILTVLSIFVYFVIAMTLFGTDHIWIEIARPVLTIFLTFAVVMAYRYITEEKDRKFLHNTFKQYISPELIDIMYKKKQLPELGGEEGIRTAYFTDIQGFSTFSEELGSPTRLVELLNEYLTKMTDTLLKHYGTLDKYEGDAIIAFFGAPVQMDDHAYQACATALDMQYELGQLRRKWISEGNKWPQIVHQMRMRIGINTGLITTGNMGSINRKNYTMMGDAVNLAARLESAAKQYGVYTMISDKTYELVKDEFAARQVDKITVVGKSEPVVVYELIDYKKNISEKMQKLLTIYQDGVNYFYSQQWDKALVKLQEAHLLEPFKEVAPKGMTPSKKMIEYCLLYKNNPPGPEWDGVMALTSK